MGASAADAADRRYAYLRKLDSHLQSLEAERLDGGGLSATARREALTLSDRGSRVLVDVYVTGEMGTAKDALRARGMEIRATSDRQPQRMVEGTLPVSALTDIAGLESTKAVLAVQGFDTNTGSVLSEGDAAHHGPQARALGPTGAGVAVGIISDSMSLVGGGVGASQATGNLPGPTSSPAGQVQILIDGSPGNKDEGRAMAEVIFDTAPGVRRMVFTTGTGGAASRAAGIDALVANGAGVIADDTVQLTEPFFQDGVVAQAVDRAKAAGVPYVAAAGDRSRLSWEGTYAPTTDPRGVSPSANDFDPAAPADAVQTLGTFTNITISIALQWDEPFGQASTDLAIDWYTISGGVPTYTGTTTDTDNIATAIPAEFGSFATVGSQTVGIAIRRKSGTRNPFMKYILNGPPTFAIAEHATDSGAIDPDAASARGALTIAASHFGTPSAPEPNSSRGPSFKLFDAAGNRLATPENRNKPDLAGADGVATSVPGFNPFFGTSAAAASVAGVAALVLSAKPSLTADQLAAILKDTRHTIDCQTTFGVPDVDCGYGFELADGAVRAALDTSPPVVTADVTPAAPDGAAGWYTSPSVSVAWTPSDPESPILSSSGCDPASVTADAIESKSCSASSIGGSASQSVTIKHDASPPSAPAISGIEARSYTAEQLPAAGAIGCSSTDPTSGLSSCVVSGYSAALGTHRLTATASNGAGLTSTSTLDYTVVVTPSAAPPPAPPPPPPPPPPLPTEGSAEAVPPGPAISALSVAKGRVTVASILRSGIKVNLKAAEARTKLRVTITLRGAPVATATRTVGAGTVRLTIYLNNRLGRRRFAAKPGTLAIRVTGSAAGTLTTTLRAALKTRR